MKDLYPSLFKSKDNKEMNNNMEVLMEPKIYEKNN